MLKTDLGKLSLGPLMGVPMSTLINAHVHVTKENPMSLKDYVGYPLLVYIYQSVREMSVDIFKYVAYIYLCLLTDFC